MREKDSQTIDREKGERERKMPVGQCLFEYNNVQYETRERANEREREREREREEKKIWFTTSNIYSLTMHSLKISHFNVQALLSNIKVC